MTNVKRITLITVCLAAILPGNGLWAQQTEATGTTQTADSVSIARSVRSFRCRWSCCCSSVLPSH